VRSVFNALSAVIMSWDPSVEASSSWTSTGIGNPSPPSPLSSGDINTTVGDQEQHDVHARHTSRKGGIGTDDATAGIGGSRSNQDNGHQTQEGHVDEEDAFPSPPPPLPFVHTMSMHGGAGGAAERRRVAALEALRGGDDSAWGGGTVAQLQGSVHDAIVTTLSDQLQWLSQPSGPGVTLIAPYADPSTTLPRGGGGAHTHSTRTGSRAKETAKRGTKGARTNNHAPSKGLGGDGKGSHVGAGGGHGILFRSIEFDHHRVRSEPVRPYK
jgi:hypothetical protein